MKAVIYLVVAGMIFLRSYTFGQTPVAEGRQLFRTYCSGCHDVHREVYGPQLASINKKRTSKWLYSFIQNSQKSIVNGDLYAINLFEEYDRAVMPSFEFLQPDQLNEIIAYISNESMNPAITVREASMPPNVIRGMQLFEQQCRTCHEVAYEKDAPALGSVQKRLPDGWLRDFVHNSQQVIQAGDRYASHLYDQYDHKIMVPMEFITDDEINDILAYIQFAASSSQTGKLKQPGTALIEQSRGLNSYTENKYSFILFAAIGSLTLVSLVYLSIKLYRNLGKQIKEK